jgi:hypothetical protein
MMAEVFGIQPTMDRQYGWLRLTAYWRRGPESETLNYCLQATYEGTDVVPKQLIILSKTKRVPRDWPEEDFRDAVRRNAHEEFMHDLAYYIGTKTDPPTCPTPT